MGETLLDVRELVCSFPAGKGREIRAVDSVSLTVEKGEIFGLVGQSGCGKTSLGKCVMGLYRPLSGSVFFRGINCLNRREVHRHRRLLQKARQLIFQDTAASLNEYRSALDIVAEPLEIHGLHPEGRSSKEAAAFWLEKVGMDRDSMTKYPPQLSGGMRQRTAIARALAIEPELVVADEPVASLDVSIQAQILNLFRSLQREKGFSMLFIAHDLSVVRYLCDRVGVMYGGKLVELADTERLFLSPLHPYTRSLISAVPIPDPRRERQRVLEVYEPRADWNTGVWREAFPGHYVLGEGDG